MFVYIFYNIMTSTPSSLFSLLLSHVNMYHTYYLSFNPLLFHLFSPFPLLFSFSLNSLYPTMSVEYINECLLLPIFFNVTNIFVYCLLYTVFVIVWICVCFWYGKKIFGYIIVIFLVLKHASYETIKIYAYY